MVHGQSGAVRSLRLVVFTAAFLSIASAVPRLAHAAPMLGRPVTIAFTRPVQGVRQVFTVAPYGGGLTQVTHEAVSITDPTWSPDGSLIAFVETLSYGEAMFVSNSDGSSVTQLLFQPGAFDGIAWSPDGTTLAMGFDPGDQGMHIWTTHIDGSRRVQLTSGASADT